MNKSVSPLLLWYIWKWLRFFFVSLNPYVPYDAFNVSLIQNMLCLNYRKQRTRHLFSTRQNLWSNACLELFVYSSELPTHGRNFRPSPEVSSLLWSRVLGNQDYFCRSFRPTVGTSDEQRKFWVTSDRGLSGDCFWTDRSGLEQFTWAFKVGTEFMNCHLKNYLTQGTSLGTNKWQ